MPPKQKPKDAGLTAKQLQNVINIVQDYWPDHPISAENIKQPTREFVMNFYEKCAEDLEKKLSFLNQYRVIPQYPPNLDPEQILFYKLSKIPLLRDADFKLGDLYVFDPKRLKNHILVIMHFLMTAENRMGQATRVCQEVFQTDHMLQTSHEKLQEQKELLNEATIKLSLAKNEHGKLNKLAEPINAKYEKTLSAMEETDKKCSGLVEEVDRLKLQIENLQEEVEKYQKTETDLKAKIVTQEEFDNLKAKLDCNVKEVEKLEEECSSNGLYDLKTNFAYLGKCLQELNHLKVPKEFLELSSLREKLKREQNDLTYELTTNNNSEAENKQTEKELEKRKQELTQENKTLQNELQILTDESVAKEKELKMMYQKEEEKYKSQIDQLQEGLKKKHDDLRRFKQGIIDNIKAHLDMKDKLLKALKE